MSLEQGEQYLDQLAQIYQQNKNNLPNQVKALFQQFQEYNISLPILYKKYTEFNNLTLFKEHLQTLKQRIIEENNLDEQWISSDKKLRKKQEKKKQKDKEKLKQKQEFKHHKIKEKKKHKQQIQVNKEIDQKKRQKKFAKIKYNYVQYQAQHNNQLKKEIPTQQHKIQKSNFKKTDLHQEHLIKQQIIKQQKVQKPKQVNKYNKHLIQQNIKKCKKLLSAEQKKLKHSEQKKLTQQINLFNRAMKLSETQGCQVYVQYILNQKGNLTYFHINPHYPNQLNYPIILNETKY